MKKKRGAVVLAAFVALTSVTVAAAMRGASEILNLDPAWSPDGGRIAFVSNRDGAYNVYLMNVDGSGRQKLTRDPAPDQHPVWSPDGRKIVFARYVKGCSQGQPLAGCDWDIFVVNSDGSGLRRLTRGPGLDRTASWSPDGRRLVFHRSLLTGGAKGGAIWVMNADGSGQRRLTEGFWPPSWSPDGQKIAFSKGSSSRRDVYVVNADGSGLRKLTRSPKYDGQPAWSPDGRKIAFSACATASNRATS